MLASQARRFGETLVDRHVLSRDDLERALQACEATGEPLPAALLRDGLVGSKDLTAALALSLGVRFVDFQDMTLHQEAPSLVPADVARAHHALAVDFEGHKLVVAFAEPADDDALSAVGAATGYEIIPAVADRAELARAIEQVYGSTASDAARDLLAELHGEELHVNQLLNEVLERLRGRTAAGTAAL